MADAQLRTVSIQMVDGDRFTFDVVDNGHGELYRRDVEHLTRLFGTIRPGAPRVLVLRPPQDHIRIREGSTLTLSQWLDVCAALVDLELVA